MRAIAVVALVLAMSSTAFAGPQSTIGGKPLKSEMVHNTGVGWPSLFYEWWNKGQGNLDWALGAELVYGDWSGCVLGCKRRFGVQRSAPLASSHQEARQGHDRRWDSLHSGRYGRR